MEILQRRQELLEQLEKNKKRLTNHPADIQFFKLAEEPNQIEMWVMEGSPCSREMNTYFRQLLNRFDFRVTRSHREDYLRNTGIHEYRIIMKPLRNTL